MKINELVGTPAGKTPMPKQLPGVPGMDQFVQRTSLPTTSTIQGTPTANMDQKQKNAMKKQIQTQIRNTQAQLKMLKAQLSQIK